MGVTNMTSTRTVGERPARVFVVVDHCNMKDLYQELTSGNIPEVRRVAELQVS